MVALRRDAPRPHLTDRPGNRRNRRLPDVSVNAEVNSTRIRQPTGLMWRCPATRAHLLAPAVGLLTDVPPPAARCNPDE